MSGIYPVEQKLVSFNGDELLGVKANDGKVYVGVKWVCEGLGLSEGQMKSERKKIQEDVVLKHGGSRYFVLPTNGGNQEVLVIELDFLPLWLAKISITPSMLVHQPDVADKLVKYQLKAKDVLAAAFIHNGFNYNDLSPELQAIFVVDKKMQNLDSRVEHLENHTTIDYAQQRLLRKAGNAKVVGVLGGKKSAAYKNNSIRSSVYSALWNDYQEFFSVASYCNTYTKDINRGLQYVPHWTPPTNLLRQIEEANGQTLF
ncbi:ORF6C domain-containing protein [Paenibacillus tundrae]|uniref:Antirepressor protein ant N-terminal domain-containing protein n=1 Tax=Paenibacillus tundrae TaxID=528187 RepID=A0ABT9W7C5_9BACL|nr:ORF6C domain-containing protein [Paenibacillus tundrae]MDQ0169149.1 hypothetical protein [Paenibacillus tundrae]